MKVKPQSKPSSCVHLFYLLYLWDIINKTLKKIYAVLLQFPFLPNTHFQTFWNILCSIKFFTILLLKIN